ncbi:MAG: hypothetical protein SCARUB_05084 [Candidatus Scalindua rubra]|uniref:Uncharacterized protein n=1 Tax=Candidatus Scalindua rubra TaxID=1872076 RepID=A0A1E3X2K4_9BACT|nr:MAG: hypothetical protein SCARUB_05084 [Candidatus Scalindua rubra]
MSTTCATFSTFLRSRDELDLVICTAISRDSIEQIFDSPKPWNLVLGSTGNMLSAVKHALAAGLLLDNFLLDS